MAQRKKLADAEWEIMDALWDIGRAATVREVREHLYPHGEKAYTTVQTTMNILVEKGFLKREKIGMVNFYSTTLSRKQAAQNETQTLVSRIFDGSFGALAAHLINSGKLSEADLREIKKLIEEREK